MELKKFSSAEFGSVRTSIIDNQIYFVGKDVAECLGYSDPNKAIAMHVDDEDKLNDKMSSSLGQRGGWFINESGLYFLIMSSKLPKAKKFKRWVTSEVLPSIRKTGMYATDQLLDNPDLAIAVFTQLKEERRRVRELETINLIQNQQILEMKPKVSYHDKILQNPDVVPITTIAKDYGYSAKKFNALLHEMSIQFKKGRIWFLYQKYADQGYTQSKTFDENGHTFMHTYWTQKGRLFLYDFLKNEGILPMIEKEDHE